MKKAILLTLILSVSQVFAQNTDEQAARKKAEYDYTYATALNAAVYGWAPFIMDVSMKLQTSVDEPMDNGPAITSIEVLDPFICGSVLDKAHNVKSNKAVVLVPLVGRYGGAQGRYYQSRW